MIRIIYWQLVALILSTGMKSGKRYDGESFRWRVLRTAVLERDGYRCRNPKCRVKASYGGTWIEVHHRRHVEHGGSYRPWNLISLCRDCHRAEHGR